MLMMMLGVAMGLLVLGYAGSVQGNNVVDERTALALSQAREALIGYATTYRDTHPGEVFGYLPCPDTGGGNEGEAASACGARDVTVIGRLPWKTLDLPPLRDATGECLWYALSGNYKNNPKTGDLFNRDTNGLIEVMAADGTTFIAGSDPTRRAIAVLFAPGAVLPGQDRTFDSITSPTICGGNYNAANYLDTDTASGIDNATPVASANAISQFIAAENSDLTAAVNDAFNDRLIHIQPENIYARHLERRRDFESHLTDPLTGLLRKAADCLVDYSRTNPGGQDHKYLPWAKPMGVSTAWGDPTRYTDSALTLGGRLPLTAYVSANGTFGNYYYNGVDGSGNPVGEPLLRGTSGACAGWSLADEFWDAWKDHLFYALARGHRVDDDDAQEDNPCSGGAGGSDDECIDVEGVDGTITYDVAAVVIFAGAAQTGQSRNNIDGTVISTDKGQLANYLEGKNLTAMQNPPVDQYSPNRRFSKKNDASNAFSNDTIMCLRREPYGSFDTRLYVDPTCGATSRCQTDGDLLAAYRVGATNNCRLGTSGINPTCHSIAERIDLNNCPGTGSATYSCERAARDFLSFECLQGITSNKCINAHTALTNC